MRPQSGLTGMTIGKNKKALSTAPELIHHFEYIVLADRRQVVGTEHCSNFGWHHDKKLEETQLGNS